MAHKSCPYFHCTNVIKYGLQNGRQRYRCVVCGHTWTNKRRPDRQLTVLWNKYAFDGRSVKSLAKEYKKSRGYIRSQLGLYVPPKIIQKPRIVSLIMDATYFGAWGVLVVIDPYANKARGENTVLYHAILTGTERTVDYEIATDTIESMGYNIVAVTIDGRRGVRTIMEAKGIPVQQCQFHQLMTITQCLTKRPRLIPNIELRAIAQTLSRTGRTVFEDALVNWYASYGEWLKERDPLTKRYTHRHTRRAYFSLCRNLPYLFTHQANYVLESGVKVANTTSPLEGRFGIWKDKLIPHRGASKQLTFTILYSFFSGATDVKNN